MDGFEVGEIVQLKSGGPKMTIAGVDTTSANTPAKRGIYCQWFAGKKLEEGYFKPESLKKSSEDGGTGQ